MIRSGGLVGTGQELIAMSVLRSPICASLPFALCVCVLCSSISISSNVECERSIQLPDGEANSCRLRSFSFYCLPITVDTVAAVIVVVVVVVQ